MHLKMQIDKQDIVLESLRDLYTALWFLCLSIFPLLQGLGKIMTEWEVLLKNNIQE